MSQLQAEFTLETDPVYIAFLRWYDGNKTLAEETGIDSHDLNMRLQGIFDNLHDRKTGYKSEWEFVGKAASFGQKMGDIRTELKNFFDIQKKTKSNKDGKYLYKLKPEFEIIEERIVNKTEDEDEEE